MWKFRGGFTRVEKFFMVTLFTCALSGCFSWVFEGSLEERAEAPLIAEHKWIMPQPGEVYPLIF